MKCKGISIAASLVVVLALLVGIFGCAQTPTPTTSPTSSPSPSTTKPAVIKWRAQDAQAPMAQDTKRFPPTGVGRIGTAEVVYDLADRINKRTGGRLQIEFAPANSIVPIGDIFSAVEKGTLDCSGAVSPLTYPGVLPEANIEGGLPFAWQNPAQFWDCWLNYGLRGKFDEIYAERNIYHCTFPLGEFYNFGSTFPIDSINAIKGKKIRAVGVYGEVVKAMGGTPTVVATTEVYQALKLGTIGGTIFGLSALEINKLKEVWKYYVMDPNMNTVPNTWLINMKSFKALPEDIQQIIREEYQYYTEFMSINRYLLGDRSLKNAEKADQTKGVNWSKEDTEKAISLGIQTWDTVAATSPRCKALVDIVKAQQRDLGRIQ